MNFVSTGVKEVTRRLLRQRNRIALANARKFVEKAEIALGRRGWRELAEDPAVRPAYESLMRLDAEVVEATERVGELEGRIREHEAAREVSRQEHAAELAQIDAERQPVREALAAAQSRHDQQAEALKEQLARKAALQAEQAAIDKEQKRAGRIADAAQRQQLTEELAAKRAALTEQIAALDAAREQAGAPMKADEEEIKRARAALSEFDARAQQTHAKLAARERAVTLAIAGVLKEIAASRREASRVEREKDVFFLVIGRRLAEREEPPPEAEEIFSTSRRHRLSYQRLAALDAAWHRESQHADRQDLRIFNFVVVTLAVLLAVAMLLILRTPSKRDWLPSNTEAIVSLNVSRFTNADFTRELQSREPDTWQQVWTGLVEKVAEVPEIDVRSQVSRITHALAPSANHGPPVDYLLVEMRSSIELDEWLREELGRKGHFLATSPNGLAMYEKAGVAVAQIGPQTLALGSTDAVEELIRVRLGLKDDLKSDAQFFSQFQRLDDDSAFRLVTDQPNELSYLTDPLLSPRLLAECQALGLTIDLHQPASAVFLLNGHNAAAVDRIARMLQSQPDQVLQLQSAEPNLFIEPPTVRTYDNQVEWRFRMTQPAARAFLQRLSRLGNAQTENAVAKAGP
jgi:multidrug efflux pump subunit AcrA (membrane-fusion protein)